MTASATRCPVCDRRYRSAERFCPADGATLIARTDDDPHVGSVIDGRYRLQQVLGRGGMGVVYMAEQTSIQRQVAVKLLSADRARKPNARARFLAEVRAASAIQSPHVVAVHDFGHTGQGEPYLVMEALPGETLRAHLSRHGTLTAEAALPLLQQIADGLAEAHALGIVHRDLKPENIFVVTTRAGRRLVKILDFGVARFLDQEQGALTQTSQIPGTPHYTSPERIAGEPLTPAADVYAFGILAYELLTGAPPFQGSTWEVLRAHVEARPPNLAEVLPPRSAPAALTRLIASTLARSPQLRPQDGAALSVAVREVSAGNATGDADLTTMTTDDVRRPPGIEPAGPPPRRRLWIGIGATIAVSLIAIAAWPTEQTDAVTPRSATALTPIPSPAAPTLAAPVSATETPPAVPAIEDTTPDTATDTTPAVEAAPAAAPRTTRRPTRPPVTRPDTSPADPALTPEEAARVDRLLP